MIRLARLVAAFLAGSALCASAADDALAISLKIERNGEAISASTILVEFGKESAFQVGQDFRVEINATDLGQDADLRMTVKTDQGAGLQQAASPRVRAAFATEFAVQFVDPSGIPYRIAITPRKTAKPA